MWRPWLVERVGRESVLVPQPAGVFARDLKECLALQLKDRNRLDPAMSALIDNIELVAKRDFDRLRAICKVDNDDLRDMIGELRQLNPKPGHIFGSEPVQAVVPDVSVRAAPDGTWLVELNNETLPRVLINNQYLAQVSRGTAREEDKTYLKYVYEVTYENYIQNPNHHHQEIARFIGTRVPEGRMKEVSGAYNPKYFSHWSELLNKSLVKCYYRHIALRYEAMFKHYGYSLTEGFGVNESWSRAAGRFAATRGMVYCLAANAYALLVRSTARCRAYVKKQLRARLRIRLNSESNVPFGELL